MQDFMMLFHSERNPDYRPSPEDIQAQIKLWQEWIGGIAAQGKLISTNSLAKAGKTLSSDGPETDVP